MSYFAALLVGFGLGGYAVAWAHRNRPGAGEASDLDETLGRTRQALARARRDLNLNEEYTCRLLDDPAFYVEQRNGLPRKARA